MYGHWYLAIVACNLIIKHMHSNLRWMTTVFKVYFSSFFRFWCAIYRIMKSLCRNEDCVLKWRKRFTVLMEGNASGCKILMACSFDKLSIHQIRFSSIEILSHFAQVCEHGKSVRGRLCFKQIYFHGTPIRVNWSTVNLRYLQDLYYQWKVNIGKESNKCLWPICELFKNSKILKQARETSDSNFSILHKKKEISLHFGGK